MIDILCGDRLLVIDDEPIYGKLIKKVAEASGFEVVVTDDPVIFVTTTRLWHPTVIMMDLNMPGTDGIQLLRTLAADQCAADVVLTSGADAKVLESAMQLGRERGLSMTEVLPKPMRTATLRARLDSFRRMPKPLLSADLAAAIAAERLFLEYQPKLDCRLGRIIGVEALVRWRHQRQGIIPPDQFIPMAEESGLIGELTDWVIAAAAAQSAEWRAGGLALAVAINISARDIEDLDLPDRLDRRCRDAGVEPASLTLELTETGAMRRDIQMMDVLTRLRLKGFKLSLDDFGTGYSSLVQLQKMPFSELKIDRFFVRQMLTNQGCRVIVEIVIDLARKLELSSIAEGVEDEATLNKLIEMGCDAIQGYHVCRPIAASRVPAFVREYEATHTAPAAPADRAA